MATIRKDEKGLWLKHGGQVVRPIASKPLEHYADLDGSLGISNEKVSAVRSRGYTSFVQGMKVKKYHIGQTIQVRVLTDTQSEIWFIQYGEKWHVIGDNDE